MRKQDVIIGGEYIAKVSGKRTRVRILTPHTTTIVHNKRVNGHIVFKRLGPYTYGWNAINLSTGRTIRIRTAGRLTPIGSEPIA